MTDAEIESHLHQLVKSERKISTKIVEVIILAEQRNLALKQGYPSTLKWLVEKFGYSERAAFRRIAAARLIKAVPEVAAKLELGEVNLTTLSQVHNAVRVQERETGERVLQLNKTEAINAIMNKSSSEAEKELMSFFPAMESSIRNDKITTIDAETSRLAVNLPNKTIEKLKRAKDLLSHAVSDGSLATIIDRIVDEYLFRNDPLKKTTQRKSAAHAQGVSGVSRRMVIQKAKGCCEFRDPKTGRVCGSSHQIEIDHIRPRALGGGNEIENLRALCRRHNILMAEINLGVRPANKWRESNE